MAKRPITIDELLYPLGHGSAIRMKAVENDLMDRFYKFIIPFIKPITCYIEGEDYILHVQIPSENNQRSTKDVFYDVVFQFTPKNKDDRASIYIRDYGVKVFSNSPSFLFIFTFVFKEHEALPTFIPEKFYAKEALKKAPKVRNEMELLGIEKSIWYAVKYLERNHLFQKMRLQQISEKNGKSKDILKVIMSQEDKLNERTHQPRKPKPKKPRAKAPEEVVEETPKNSPTTLTKENPIQAKNFKQNALQQNKSSFKSSTKTSMKTSSLKSSGFKNSLGKKK